MFLRKKRNKTGSISVSIVEKREGKLYYLHTVGYATDDISLRALEIKGNQQINRLKATQPLEFNYPEDTDYLNHLRHNITSVKSEVCVRILEQLFADIGFGTIKDDLFRHLVIMRLLYPVSKLKTTEHLYHHYQISYDIDYLYRYMDKLLDYQELLQQICYNHTLQILQSTPAIVFYDVTTLYFEAEAEDDLRKTGFSKDGKHQHPQIVLGLLVSGEGYPLAYDIFEGNTFEGKTMLPVITAFKKRFSLQHLIIVADAGLLSNKNIQQIIDNGDQFILAARIKNESGSVQQQILSLCLQDGQSAIIDKTDGTRLIVSYASGRAKKDAYNRQRGIAKLELALKSGKLSKKHINNRGYNKYLKMDGVISVSIDYYKLKEDEKWDGLKGYITNTQLDKEHVITQYKNLWQIEKAFRISKTDIRARPIYHRLAKRIKSHLNICFCSYKLYKEMERVLKQNNTGLSPNKALEILKSIYTVETILPASSKKASLLIVINEEQKRLLNSFNLYP